MRQITLLVCFRWGDQNSRPYHQWLRQLFSHWLCFQLRISTMTTMLPPWHLKLMENCQMFWLTPVCINVLRWHTSCSIIVKNELQSSTVHFISTLMVSLLNRQGSIKAHFRVLLCFCGGIETVYLPFFVSETRIRSCFFLIFAWFSSMLGLLYWNIKSYSSVFYRGAQLLRYCTLCWWLLIFLMRKCLSEKKRKTKGKELDRYQWFRQN